MQKLKGLHIKSFILSKIYLKLVVFWLFYKIKLLLIYRPIIIVSLVEHLGDIVACEPVLQHLNKKYPKHKILWIVKKQYAPILKGNPFIYTLLQVDSLSAAVILEKKLRYCKNVLFYNFHFDGRICSKYGLYNFNDKNRDITLDNYYLHGSLFKTFTLAAGMHVEYSQPRIYLEEEDKPNINIPEHYWVIHTESNEENRMWTEDKWKELIERLIGIYNVNIIEVGLNGLSNVKTNNYHSLCGKTNIREVAYLIKKSSLFIGVDSSFAHFAHAFSVKSYVLLGAYNKFTKYNPYGDGPNAPAIITKPVPLKDIDVDFVLNGLTERLGVNKN